MVKIILNDPAAQWFNPDLIEYEGEEGQQNIKVLARISKPGYKVLAKR